MITQSSTTKSPNLVLGQPTQSNSTIPPSLPSSVGQLSHHLLTSNPTESGCILPSVMNRLMGLLVERHTVESSPGSSKTVNKLLSGIDGAITATLAMQTTSSKKLTLPMNQAGLLGGTGFGGGSSRNSRTYVPVTQSRVDAHLDYQQEQYYNLANPVLALRQEVRLLESELSKSPRGPRSEEIRQTIHIKNQQIEENVAQIARIRENKERISRFSSDIIDNF
jgi:hypothetical protein